MADNTRNPQYLGDILTTLLEKTGVAQTVRTIEKATGKDCGCAKRRQQLNEFHQKHLMARAARREK